ncbi:MAG: CpaF family protein [Actinomycetota bacterium]
MKLSDYLREREREEDPSIELQRPTAADPMWLVRKKLANSLYERLGTRLFDAQLGQERLEEIVSGHIDDLLIAEGTPLRDAERAAFISQVLDDVMGLGPIEQFLHDPTVTEVMVNSTDPIYIERSGRIEQTSVRFATQEHLRRVIDRIVSGVGRRIDESSPMVDARLADGSRVNAIIPPLAVDGPVLTIRKFSNDKLDISQLIAFGAITPQSAALLGAAVKGALTVLVSGGTGTGKTTMLNILSSYIPDTERIVTIEDAVELKLRQRHVVRLESRPPNLEGQGEVRIRDLVRNSLRMRPDRIIVGEVRGPEALDMLQAINTGHDGSLATIHANSPRDALSRLETMVIMAGFDLPIRAIRDQISSGFDIIVQMTRFRDGTRKVSQISEVTGMEGDIITLSDIYTFDHQSGVDTNGRILGSLQPTGVPPSFLERLADRGIEYSTPIDEYSRTRTMGRNRTR